MSVDTLITIGVVIYIIVSIRKALKHGKKPEGDAKPTGWRGKLKDMADQIKEEIEKANLEMKEQQQQQRQEQLPTRSGRMEEENDYYWDDELDYDEEAEEELELPEPAPVMRESVLYEPRKVTSMGVEGPPEESHRNHPGAAMTSDVPGLRGEHSRSRIRQRSRKRLRQAVIWSEILDKPLALRED